MLRVLVALVCLCACMVQPAGASDAAWRALQQGGVVALIRHARAPGVGDPPGFRLEDCATQRNLSEGGREQARRLGAAFRDHGVAVARVLSSQWCRCLDTARLAFGDGVEPLPALNSFFAKGETEGAQTRAVRAVVEGWRDQPGVLALVTHQVNITALTGVFPDEGEILVLKPGAAGFDLVARFRP